MNIDFNHLITSGNPPLYDTFLTALSEILHLGSPRVWWTLLSSIKRIIFSDVKIILGCFNNIV